MTLSPSKAPSPDITWGFTVSPYEFGGTEHKHLVLDNLLVLKYVSPATKDVLLHSHSNFLGNEDTYIDTLLIHTQTPLQFHQLSSNVFYSKKIQFQMTYIYFLSV